MGHCTPVSQGGGHYRGLNQLYMRLHQPCALPVWMSMEKTGIGWSEQRRRHQLLRYRNHSSSAAAARSNAQKAFITCGARLSIFFNLVRFSVLYMCVVGK